MLINREFPGPTTPHQDSNFGLRDTQTIEAPTWTIVMLLVNSAAGAARCIWLLLGHLLVMEVLFLERLP
jgi:hypothetical protein